MTNPRDRAEMAALTHRSTARHMGVMAVGLTVGTAFWAGTLFGLLHGGASRAAADGAAQGLAWTGGAGLIFLLARLVLLHLARRQDTAARALVGTER
ncbi:hypothetical protein ACFV1W_25265 [Kitasatospora sp. NPDC059648]|uniref:hypothetical protein n=1 Tax=Kitasatospora sp. NPDC059648 TaxID=3346894 RepID=UPI0036AD7F5C